MTVEHVVCPCTMVWSSVLPPPRCGMHNPQVVDVGWWVGPFQHMAQVEELGLGPLQ